MQYGPKVSSSKRLGPVSPLDDLQASGRAGGLGTWYSMEKVQMDYPRHAHLRDAVKSERDRFRIMRANSSKRLLHKLRRKGHLSWFLRCWKHATWSNKVVISPEFKKKIAPTWRDICFLYLFYFSEAGSSQYSKRSKLFLLLSAKLRNGAKKIFNNHHKKELKNCRNRANWSFQELTYLLNFM
jgi:hypothetical protein